MEPVRFASFEEAYAMVRAIEALGPSRDVLFECQYCRRVFTGLDLLMSHLKSWVNCGVLARVDADIRLKGMPLEDERRRLRALAHTLQEMIIDRVLSRSDLCDLYDVVNELTSLADGLAHIADYVVDKPASSGMLDMFYYFKLPLHHYIAAMALVYGRIDDDNLTHQIREVARSSLHHLIAALESSVASLVERIRCGGSHDQYATSHHCDADVAYVCSMLSKVILRLCGVPLLPGSFLAYLDDNRDLYVMQSDLYVLYPTVLILHPDGSFDRTTLKLGGLLHVAENLVPASSEG